MSGHLLLIEDRASLRRMLSRALEGEGYTVTAAADGAEGGRRLAEEGPFDLVLTDLRLPGASGLELLAASRERWPEVPVVVMTAFGTIAAAVEAMKLGAADFLEKPVELDALFARVGELLQPETSSQEPFVAGPGCPPIVGRHSRLRAVIRLLRRVAPTEATVLIEGESGTGKELFGRALHALSERRDGPYVPVNCAAIPEALLENELFGHEKGAFTGAHRRQAGRFEAARGGTLFLDEIGELPLAVQGKILRVLEERVFERVGSSTPQVADVRLVAATNRDLRTMVADGEFRSDLFFRLEVFPLHLPALRDRGSDVPALTAHLLGRIAERHRLESPSLQADALAWLREQPWPGNVRELGNLLERIAIVHAGQRVGLGELKAARRAARGGNEASDLRRALEATGGDKRAAAERLGISDRTLRRKVKEHGLEGFPHYRS